MLARIKVGTYSSEVRRALAKLSGSIIPIIEAHLHSHVYNELCSVQPDGVETSFPSDFKFKPGTMVIKFGGVAIDELKWQEDSDCHGVTFDQALPKSAVVKLRMSYEIAEG